MAILKDIAVFVAERADSLQVQVIYTVHLLAIGTHITFRSVGVVNGTLRVGRGLLRGSYARDLVP